MLSHSNPCAIITVPPTIANNPTKLNSKSIKIVPMQSVIDLYNTICGSNVSIYDNDAKAESFREDFGLAYNEDNVYDLLDRLFDTIANNNMNNNRDSAIDSLFEFKKYYKLN